MSNMNFLYVLILFFSINTVFCDDKGPPSGISPRRDLTFTELASYDGYTAEQHFVTTQDGYILGLHRLPVQGSCKASKGVMMFMHGLYLSGDDCLIPGPGKAHCYVYSDNCYDVWVPNNRGNFYSRNHTKLNPDKDSAFWDFSVDEIAMFDLPAVIDYVLLKTNETQLSYVAHSQGVSALLILCAKKPEYNAKIKVGFGLSPTAWMYHSRFIVIKFQSIIAPGLSLTNSFLNQEVLKRNGILQISGEFACGSNNQSYPFCSELVFAVLGYNKFQITEKVLPVVTGHTPSGTSLKNFVRWGQMQNNGFSEYDYGFFRNFFTYGRGSPPLNTSNMNFLGVLILLCSIVTVFCDNEDSPFGISPRQDLPFTGLAAYDGYKAEQHFVTTEDGYILGVNRLPLQGSCKASKGVMMFMHGLYLSGDDCLIPGPGKAHCYVYSDNCYDVWVPNVRGNFYSRNHTTLNPDKDSAFWDFSIDEMSIFDLPAAIDYVLLKTNETQLSYVAHSQGVAKNEVSHMYKQSEVKYLNLFGKRGLQNDFRVKKFYNNCKRESGTGPLKAGGSWQVKQVSAV
ncbi:hypothetical protein PYW07_007546 [Mythimna separata]|uniref:Partial AB-hydrolase lipase domain-containing protein n=1 Tax=Mythimna separata TaxID=271217 RepID=A0AAD8E1G4_MYTSE|nr:hypothetical protein PYW07_007546 [Mythimna separata]